jgi:trimeric autotransporter adhesin
MKNKLFAFLALVFLSTLNPQLSTFAQGTAFTYQGRLNTNGVAYTGAAEFQFTLWDAVSGGSAVATNNPASLVATVTDGLFTVTLDFGLNPFNGQPRFLDTEVRTVIGPFTTLTPRQPVTATPYALRALNLTTNGLAGTYGNAVTFDNAANSFAGAFTGAVSGNGSGLTSVNATTLGGLSSANFWKTNGNAGANPTNGAFLGTTDNLPLEIKVNGHRVLRIEPSDVAPNIIGGYVSNVVDAGVIGATIGGGGSISGPNRISANLATIAGGGQNTNQGNFGTISGGGNNNIQPDNFSFATIGGGAHNKIAPGATYSTISGGQANEILTGAQFGSIGGGNNNTILTNAELSTISGGNNNTILNSSSFATIPGGDSNTATNYAFAAGRRAKANHQGAFIWADSQNADFASTASNQFLVRASGGVGIGTASPSRELEVQHAGDTEIGLKSTDTGGHLWTLQSSSVSGSANVDASFQIIDRTLGGLRLLIGTNGNVGIGTSNPTNKLQVIGGITCTALIQTSDRNAKENFKPVSPSDVLAKVAALPISSWNFKEMHDGRHLGPMAQDFYAAFNLGGSDTSITVVDESGVTLAAIQGLNQKLNEKDAEIQQLKQRLDKLETLISNSTDKQNGGKK